MLTQVKKTSKTGREINQKAKMQPDLDYTVTWKQKAASEGQAEKPEKPVLENQPEESPPPYVCPCPPSAPLTPLPLITETPEKSLYQPLPREESQGSPLEEGIENPRRSIRLIEKGLGKPNPESIHERNSESSRILPVRTVPAMIPAPDPIDPGKVAYKSVNTFTYVPFSSSDLLNWKNHGPSYEEEPEKFVDMVEGIVSAQNPTWSDIQQLQGYLMTTEQRMQIQVNLEEAAGKIARQEGVRDEDRTMYIARYAPTVNPRWDLSSGADRTAMRQYQQAFVEAVKKGRKRMMNMQKIHDVVQEKDESPGAFLERLFKAYRRYTPIDPEDERNRQTVVLAFVSQSAPDIRKKLQKAEGFEGMPLRQLKVLADKVFLNRDVEEKREQAKRMKEKANLLAAVLRPQESREQFPHPRPSLGRNQCAYCKKEGHWKN
ncbi:palmitoyltransferase ZDHHC14 isoform X6 [Rhineura floridana]|uniref:palmitoyltransferase ZDHHC14 isoform X6 n=1 Tax=Rhineura floridana TaxID=261503 RepID=UPI002AC82A05|nr:palmitoyltransferase ZDHHC14 isoform X6 [Rhineura floridana]